MRLRLRWLRAAAAYAASRRVPLNRFLTLAWNLGEVGDAPTATGRFLKLYTDAFRKAGFTSAWAYVHEVGPVVGVHTHLLLHVPNDRREWFNRLVGRWLKLCGAKKSKGVRHSRPVGWLAYDPGSETYSENLRAAVDYMLKGVHPSIALSAGVSRPAFQGLIEGKRLAVSLNIGRNARLLADCVRPI